MEALKKIPNVQIPYLENSFRVSIGGHLKKYPEEIVAFVGMINYSEVYLNSGKKILVATHLKLLENRFFKYGFFRTHKSMIVNTAYLINKNPQTPGELQLETNLPVVASRRKFESFKLFNELKLRSEYNL